jgi:hypothetical protein
MKFSKIILIIAIILWGVLLGGVVYSHIVYFPVFLSNLPDSAVLVNGTYALHDERFWMVIHPVLIVALIITITTNWKNKPKRKKILISFVLYAVVLIISGIYFIPELIDFSKSPTSLLPPSEWLRRSGNWMTYSIIRGIIMFAGIIPLFIALLKPDVSKL